MGYRAALALPAAALALGGWLLYRAMRLPFHGPTDAAPATFRLVAPAPMDDLDPAVLQSDAPRSPVSGGRLAGRFRLAGTFFSYDAESETRRAILDDLSPARGQHIVSEGDRIDAIEVLRIYDERVVLGHAGRETELWLGFTSAAPATVGGDDDELAAVYGGRKVGENQWVFRRQTLVDLYQQILDDPQRLLAIFASLKDVHGEDGRVTGYRLDPEGEQDFFRAVGMREGDIVRQVNGLGMTSRRRAEFLIGEFARNRANAFTFDIERDGQPVTLTYQIR